MSKNPPAFQLYASDFLVDTQSWTATEVGIYARLLFHQWVNGSIPDNIQRLTRIGGTDVRTMQKCWLHTLGGKFQKCGNGNLINGRLEQTRKDQEEYRKKLIESGRLGGLRTQEAKRKKQSDPSSDPSSNASTEPSSEMPSENQALQSSSSVFKEKELKATTAPVDNPEKQAPIKDQKEHLKKLCKILESSFKNFNPYQFIQKAINLKIHPEPIIKTLSRMIEDKAEIISPWPWAEHVLKIESQNFNERDFQNSTEKDKSIYDELLSDIKELHAKKQTHQKTP